MANHSRNGRRRPQRVIEGSTGHEVVAGRHLFDVSAIPLVQQLSHLPIIADPDHVQDLLGRTPTPSPAPDEPEPTGRPTAGTGSRPRPGPRWRELAYEPVRAGIDSISVNPDAVDVVLHRTPQGCLVKLRSSLGDQLGTPGIDGEVDTHFFERFRGVANVEVDPVASPEQILEAQRAVDSVRVDETVRNYLLAIIASTRSSRELRLGASPRASIMLLLAPEPHRRRIVDAHGGRIHRRGDVPDEHRALVDASRDDPLAVG